MAADEYVKSAAAHLQEAATALKNDMDHIRGEFMTYDRQVTHDITTKDAERRSHLMRASTSSDPNSGAHLMAEAQRLKAEIDMLKSNLDQRRRQVDQAVKGKESAMNNLMSQSRSLQNQAGSLK
jgi:transposase